MEGKLALMVRAPRTFEDSGYTSLSFARTAAMFRTCSAPLGTAFQPGPHLIALGATHNADLACARCSGWSAPRPPGNYGTPWCADRTGHPQFHDDGWVSRAQPSPHRGLARGAWCDRSGLASSGIPWMKPGWLSSSRWLSTTPGRCSAASSRPSIICNCPLAWCRRRRWTTGGGHRQRRLTPAEQDHALVCASLPRAAPNRRGLCGQSTAN